MLPGAHYLVRMLDGRIDTQGSVKDLRERGLLDEITHDESVEAHKEEVKAEAEVKIEEPNAEIDADAPEDEDADADAKPDNKKGKKPRKLIEDEKREEGSVKWSIYNTYLKAS